MAMRHTGWVRTLGVGAVVGIMALAGCGDDGGGSGTPDARPNTADARPAADATMGVQATHSGTVAVNDISVFGSPSSGHGGQINIGFSKLGVTPEMQVGSTATPPCYATLTDVTKAAQANPTVDEGTIKVEIKTAAGGTRPVPDCKFASNRYLCASGQGTDGTLTLASTPVYSFAGTGAGMGAAGHYLLVVGGTGAGAAFPIVAASSGTMLTVVSTLAATPPSVGAWVTAAGIGPIPPIPGVAPTPPEFLADDDKVKVSLAGGTDFGAQATGDIEVGKEFELSDATAALFAAKIDLATTAAIEISCKKAGAACPTATGTIVSIDTTDATTFASGSDMGTAVKFTGSLTCAAFDEKVTIPANLWAVLKAGSPTKMRVAVFRSGFSPLQDTVKKNATNVVAGHGIIFFQTF